MKCLTNKLFCILKKRKAKLWKHKKKVSNLTVLTLNFWNPKTENWELILLEFRFLYFSPPYNLVNVLNLILPKLKTKTPLKQKLYSKKGKYIKIWKKIYICKWLCVTEMCYQLESLYTYTYGQYWIDLKSIITVNYTWLKCKWEN